MSKAYMPLFLVMCLGLIFLMNIGFIFLLLALLPTIVAFYIDTDSKKTTFQVVGAGNLGATLPTLVPMIKGNMHSLQGAHHYDYVSVIQDPSVWLFIYLGAAAGWGLIYLCRYIARFLVTMSYEYNINMLKRQQRRLIEEWGTEIDQTASMIDEPAIN